MRLNTSHVLIYLNSAAKMQAGLDGLNTSHVLIYHYFCYQLKCINNV